MTGFGFGKGPPLTDEQRAVHDIRADETMALHARIAELEAALKQSSRIEASLASRIANLIDALEPFADLAEKYGGDVDDQPLWDRDFMPVVGDLRAARAAYLGEKG